MTANRLGDRRVGRRLSTCVVLSACMTLACSERPDADADRSANPVRPSSSALSGLRQDLARIVGQESPARGDTLLQMFQERGFDPLVQQFPNAATDREQRAVGRNLIVTISEGHRDIVVGAHYDVVRLPDGEVTGGAVDNGAAAVVLVRVAETLQRHNLNHRVRVVLFDLEEIGLLGSRAFVQDQDTDRIAAMVNVDVVADDGVLMYGPTAHEGNEVVYSSLRAVCAVGMITCMSFPQYPPSDDRAFQAAGIPNVSLGMNGPISSHQLWLLLNAGADSGLRPDFVPDLLQVIHTSEDTMERVGPAAMAQVHDAVVGLVLELDKALQRPAATEVGGVPGEERP